MTNQISRRHLLQGLGALPLATAFAPGAAFAQSSHLTAAITGYSVVNSIDPAKASLIPEFYVIWGVFNGLMKFDDDMNVVPDLADTVTPIDTGGYEFTLKDGVTFHDGSTLTAEDVKFTFDRLMAEETASPNAAKLAKVTAVEVVDPLTVRVLTDGPYAPLLTFLTNARTGTQIVSKAAFESMGAEAFAQSPVGTGPYKVSDWRAGEGLTLAAHADYFEGTPNFATVDVPLIAEEASGVTALRGGQIDMTSTAPAADVSVLMDDDSIQVLRQPGLNTRFISINLRKAPFDDIHVRRAMSMAFQREAMVQAVIFGEGVTAQGLIPPQLPAYYDETPRPWMSYDPEAAKAELAKSKYAPEDIAFGVVTWSGGWWKRYAEIFVAQVNQTLGTNITVDVTDANTAYARQKSGDFEAGVWGWLGMVDPHEYVGDILTSDGWRNFQGYSNAEVDALAAKGLAATDAASRADFYKQAEAIAMDEVAVIPCFCSNIHNLLRADLDGFVQKPYSNFADQFRSMSLG